MFYVWLNDDKLIALNGFDSIFKCVSDLLIDWKMKLIIGVFMCRKKGDIGEISLGNAVDIQTFNLQRIC